jgi:hypothetical protein
VEEKEKAPLAVSDIVVPAIATAKAEAVAKIYRIPCVANRVIARLADSTKRFVSSFRGQTVHGVEVALLGGYVGVIIVLRADAHDKSHQTLASNLKRQPARLRQLRSQKV